MAVSIFQKVSISDSAPRNCTFKMTCRIILRVVNYNVYEPKFKGKSVIFFGTSKGIFMPKVLKLRVILRKQNLPQQPILSYSSLVGLSVCIALIGFTTQLG